MVPVGRSSWRLWRTCSNARSSPDAHTPSCVCLAGGGGEQASGAHCLLRFGACLVVRREAPSRPGKHLVVADAKRLDPALLPERQPDEEAQFDELWVGEVLVQALPKRVVGQLGVPDDRGCVGQRCLFALGEFVGVLEVEQFGVLRLRDAFRSRPDRSLYPSVLALNGLRDVHAAEFLDLVVEHALTKCGLPGL